MCSPMPRPSPCWAGASARSGSPPSQRPPPSSSCCARGCRWPSTSPPPAPPPGRSLARRRWPPTLRGERGRLDAFDTGDPASSARTVFSWSYRSLSQPAARMFRLLGLHPGPDITEAAAASLAGVAADQAHRSLAELTAAHLVTEQVPGRFSFHDLLRAYAAEQARLVRQPAGAARRSRPDAGLLPAHGAGSGQVSVPRPGSAHPAPATGRRAAGAARSQRSGTGLAR